MNHLLYLLRMQKGTEGGEAGKINFFCRRGWVGIAEAVAVAIRGMVA